MDGAFPDQFVHPGEDFLYEFDADPVGIHLYHCHSFPLKRHIHKGLYGAYIVDPKEGRSPAQELVMVMNGFDTNFDGDNEVYAVNTVAFYYMNHPIKVKVNELVRVYLVNITEFDPINSFSRCGRPHPGRRLSWLRRNLRFGETIPPSTWPPDSGCGWCSETKHAGCSTR